MRIAPYAALLPLTLLVLGCPGRVIVSDPEVFTRERLVQERFEDYQWLKEQLDKAPETTRFQGVHDFREFVGVYNRLEAKFDPSQGKLNQLDNDIVLLNKQLEKEKAEQRLHKFRESQDEAKGGDQPKGNGTSPGNIEPPVKPNGAGKSADTMITQELAKKIPLPKASEAEETKAKAGILDLFHDQLAYRNAVRAAMRERQLDDSHDLFGSMMYDLQFDLTLIPGWSKDRFAQVSITLMDKVPTDDDLNRLYTDWVEQTGRSIRAEVQRIQHEYKSDAMRQDDVQWLVDTITERLNRPLGTANARLDQLYRYEAMTTAAEKQVYLKMNPGFVGALDIDQPTAPPTVAEADSQLDKKILKQARIQLELQKLQAQFLSGGEIAQHFRHYDPAWEDAVFAAIAWSMWVEQSERIGKFVEVIPPDTTHDHFKPIRGRPLLTTIEDSLSGNAEFNRRLRERSSRQLVAASVEPKEYAQNISDVAARENLLALVASLQAVLPQYGADIKNESEYIRRTQEFVQAINRQPLAIGFGEGKSKFGWVLGPKFEVAPPRPFLWWFTDLFYGRPLAQFSHSHVRHAFRASIVVPAWWEDVKIQTKYCWLNSEGACPSDSKETEHELEIRLPRPTDKWEAITRAITRSTLDARVKPTIEYPDPGRAGRLLPILREYQLADRTTHRQTILIQGSDLWRNPQVFVGTLQATRVNVLSDMRGLEAVFDFREDNTPPQKFADGLEVPLDLTIVTSTGAVTVPRGIIYKAAKKEGKQGSALAARINQPRVVAGSTRLTLLKEEDFPRAFHSLKLLARPAEPPGGEWLVVTDPLQWDPARTKFSSAFQTFKKTDGTTYTPSWIPQELELRLLAHMFPDDPNPAALPLEPPTIVYAAAANADALKVVLTPVTTQLKTHRATDRIKLSLPSDGKLVYKAYPALVRAVEQGEVRIVLKDPAQQKKELIFRPHYPSGEKRPINFIIEPEDWEAKKESLPSAATKYDVYLRVGSEEIPANAQLDITSVSQ